jgi:hypothetical protein
MRSIVFAILVATVTVGASVQATAQCRPGSNCQAKCDATWQAGGYHSAAECYAVWAVANSHGPAYSRAKENANRVLGWKRDMSPSHNLGPIKKK